MGRFVVFVLLCALVGVIVYKVRAKVKPLGPLGTISVVTGAVKTGKSTLAVHLAIKSYRRTLRAYYIQRYILRRDVDKPLLYSNIPLACDFVMLDKDILLRKKRVVPKSVVLVDEASLLADSQYIRDGVVNKQLLLFFKLFGHMSHGGSMIIDTHAISDLHYAIKRSINQYTYIRLTHRLPFFLVMDVLEQRYADDGTIVSAQTDDIDANLRHVIISRFAWRMFDTYAFSILTDHLPVKTDVIHGKDLPNLKTHEIVSFRDWKDNKN